LKERCRFCLLRSTAQPRSCNWSVVIVKARHVALRAGSSQRVARFSCFALSIATKTVYPAIVTCALIAVSSYLTTSGGQNLEHCSVELTVVRCVPRRRRHSLSASQLSLSKPADPSEVCIREILWCVMARANVAGHRALFLGRKLKSTSASAQTLAEPSSVCALAVDGGPSLSLLKPALNERQD
jgi:hypothetical protein